MSEHTLYSSQPFTRSFVDSTMFLSIIIPHYNLPDNLLERCLQSIITLGLPFDDYEVIVIDDGSKTPPTWATSLSRNIKLINAPHGGPGNARNIGIEQACGNYIMFVDADDYLINNGEIFNCIEKLKEERPQILRYHYIVEKEGSKPTRAKKKKTKFNNTISGATFMEKHNLSGSPCIYFFQRELALRKGIKFPTNIFHEDEEFNTILHYHAQTLIESNAVLYAYCIRNGSTTANQSASFKKERVKDMLHIIERIHFFVQSNKEKSNAIQARATAHKLDMLTADVILNMMYAGMNAKEIKETCKERLSPIGLYPLRKASYSLKYRIFRATANNTFGLHLLRKLFPKHKSAKK